MRVKKGMKSILAAALLAATWSVAGTANAIVVTAETNATDLANAVTAGGTGLVVTSATLSGQSSGGAVSSGTYTNATGTYAIGGGIVISSGDVQDYGDGPNTESGHTTNYGTSATTAQEGLLDPITGGGLDHFDVTQLDLEFTTNTGNVFFLVVFGSDEFDEFVGSTFIDAFGLYLNDTNIAQFNGDPINIDHPDMDFRAGTELDGVLPGSGTPMLFSASGLSTTDTHTLTFIIADSGDNDLDSTAYIASLGGTEPPNGVPEPGTAALLGLAGLALVGTLRRRRG
jgi:hypothetical protein